MRTNGVTSAFVAQLVAANAEIERYGMTPLDGRWSERRQSSDANPQERQNAKKRAQRRAAKGLKPGDPMPRPSMEAGTARGDIMAMFRALPHGGTLTTDAVCARLMERYSREQVLSALRKLRNYLCVIEWCGDGRMRVTKESRA